MSPRMGSVSSRRVLVSLSGGVLALVLAFAPGCGKGAGDGSPTLVTIGSRKVSLADFEAYARDPQIVQPYLGLPDSIAKQTLLDDLLSYELFAEAATRQGLDKDSAYLAIDGAARCRASCPTPSTRQDRQAHQGQRGRGEAVRRRSRRTSTSWACS